MDATIDPKNRASWRILEKLGFVPIGEELDEYGLPTLRLRLDEPEVAGPRRRSSISCRTSGTVSSARTSTACAARMPIPAA